ncbi:MAG: hypothetical protein AB4042_04765 [Leptolyngbyaceae cyanobacterium]
MMMIQERFRRYWFRQLCTCLLVSLFGLATLLLNPLAAQAMPDDAGVNLALTQSASQSSHTDLASASWWQLDLSTAIAQATWDDGAEGLDEAVVSEEVDGDLDEAEVLAGEVDEAEPMTAAKPKAGAKQAYAKWTHLKRTHPKLAKLAYLKHAAYVKQAKLKAVPDEAEELDESEGIDEGDLTEIADEAEATVEDLDETEDLDEATPTTAANPHAGAKQAYVKWVHLKRTHPKLAYLKHAAYVKRHQPSSVPDEVEEVDAEGLTEELDAADVPLEEPDVVEGLD